VVASGSAEPWEMRVSAVLWETKAPVGLSEMKDLVEPKGLVALKATSAPAAVWGLAGLREQLAPAARLGTRAPVGR